MSDSRPNGDPDHDPRVQRGVMQDDNVVYSVIEQRNETGDTDDGQGLDAEDAEHHGCQGGGEQGFVDAEIATCATVHVEGERDGWEEAVEASDISMLRYLHDHGDGRDHGRGDEDKNLLDEEYTNRARKSPVIEPIRDIAEVVRQPPANIPIHASPGPQHTIALPSRDALPSVGIPRWIRPPRARTIITVVHVCTSALCNLECVVRFVEKHLTSVNSG